MDSLQSLFTHIIHLYYGKASRKLKELEVHPKQVPMLFLLGRKEGLSQREICEEMKIKASTVAVSIKRMEKSGLLVRREDEKDQRIWRIYLTERGKRIGCSLKEIVEESEAAVFQGFSEEEMHLMKCFFRRMIENLEQVKYE